MEEKQLKVFESDNLWKSIFKMVIPALIAILVMLIYNMADMIFVGQTGVTAQVAAVSVVSPVFNIIMAVAMLISGGGTGKAAPGSTFTNQKSVKKTKRFEVNI